MGITDSVEKYRPYVFLLRQLLKVRGAKTSDHRLLALLLIVENIAHGSPAAAD